LNFCVNDIPSCSNIPLSMNNRFEENLFYMITEMFPNLQILKYELNFRCEQKLFIYIRISNLGYDKSLCLNQ